VKKFLTILSVFIIIGTVLSLTFALMPAYSMIGRGFLMSVGQGNYAQAYEMLSEDLQRQYTLPKLKAEIESIGLNYYDSVKWVKEEEDKPHNRGYLMGVVTTKPLPTTGRIKLIPLQIEIIKVESSSLFGSGYRINAISILNKDSSSH